MGQALTVAVTDFLPLMVMLENVTALRVSKFHQ